MDLTNALLNLATGDSRWGIWAELVDGKFTKESKWRYGQPGLKNDELLDDKVLLCNGRQILSWLTDYGLLDKTDAEIASDHDWINAFLDHANKSITL